MRIPLLDLAAQHAAIRDEALAAITRLADAQRFIMGEEVELLEREIAAYCDARFAVGCSSGSDALYLALRALDIGPGDEVLTSPFTFFATAGSISLAGATPVFADIDPATFNLDPEAARRVLRGRPRVKAIMPVHLYGGCAHMDEFLAMGLPVIEDAAQSIGAEYKGRRAGSMGAINCFSFYPGKNLGAWGDAGIVTTNDEALAARLRRLRVHGSDVRYVHREIGINARLDALQAAVLRVKLKRLDEWTRARQCNAAWYTERLQGLEIAPPPLGAHQTRHVYNQFVIRAPRRDALREWLASQGVGTEIYYPIPLHLQECYAHLGYAAGDFPEAERAAREVLAIPVYPELPEDHRSRVADLLLAFE